MIAPVIGALILLATLGVSAVTLVLMILARLQRRERLFRTAATAALAAVVSYGGAWAVGLATAPGRVVPVGEAISFCGVDCHLYVSVLRSERAGDLAVTLRFRSDARAADEYPGLLTIAAVDQAGRRYPPASGMVAEPLGAGAAVEREFRFSVPAAAGPVWLVVSYEGVMDYLVPGRANPLAQRRVRLAVGA